MAPVCLNGQPDGDTWSAGSPSPERAADVFPDLGLRPAVRSRRPWSKAHLVTIPAVARNLVRSTVGERAVIDTKILLRRAGEVSP